MRRLGLFEGVGVEIEYMIVDRESLDVRPICDRLIERMSGEPVSEFERGSIAWSNELVLHVLELKTNGPAATLEGLGRQFHAEVRTAIEALHPLESTLLAGGVHPWMNPSTETHLWPHEFNEVYRTFDRIFGCAGHGWSNLQSTHVNLPFSGDDEFRRLHAAIRAILPLIPALSAASPFLDGVLQPALDARLEAYRHNAKRVPQVAGLVVPEPVRSEQEYRERILTPLYAALAPHDPDGVLAFEWANARGAIARFERGAIEIRLIDAQECPTGDIAVVALVVAVLRALTEERWTSCEMLDEIETETLASILDDTVQLAEGAQVTEGRLLQALGIERSQDTAAAVWRSLADRLAPDDVPDEYGASLETIVAHGSLASRMSRAHVGGAPIRDVVSGLVASLDDDRMFVG